MRAPLLRLLGRLIDALTRVQARLDRGAPAGGGGDDAAPREPEPPAHWLAHVRARAPHLVQGGGVRATFAAPDRKSVV